MHELDAPSEPPDCRVLMIAYAFPPVGGSGVQRSAKFAKYLPKFGWMPTVWAADQPEGFPADDSLAADLPSELRVLRMSAGNGLQTVRRVLHDFSSARPPLRPRGLTTRLAAAIDWRLHAWQTRTGFPDECAAWARRASSPLEIAGHERFDALYSTYSPASNHLLALELKRRTGLPWVADFRDLWTDDFRYREPFSRRREEHRRLEQEFLQSADAVIGVTPRQTEILASRLPRDHAKFHTITNGFDPDDFRGRNPRRPADRRFVLAYVGRFDLVRTSGVLGEALRAFADRLGKNRAQFVLRLAGHVNATARAMLDATGIACEYLDYLPHNDAIRCMRTADALLLTSPFDGNGDTIICAKLFEYLAAHRPILQVGPEGGECDRIVRECNAGVSVGLQADEILAGLTRLFDAWAADRPLPGCPPEAAKPYSRVRLTADLAGVLDGVTARRNAKNALQVAGEVVCVS